MLYVHYTVLSIREINNPKHQAYKKMILTVSGWDYKENVKVWTTVSERINNNEKILEKN